MIADASLDLLIAAYERGLPTAQACALSGIGQTTVDRWLTRAENDEQRRNGDRVRLAQAQYADAALAAVTASHSRDWRSAAWNFEHNPTYRDAWGTRVETDADTASVQVLASLGALLAARVAASEVPTPQTPRLLESSDPDATEVREP